MVDSPCLERTWCTLPGLRFIAVGGIGLEPTTFAMSTQCSNQLSYPPERICIIHHNIYCEREDEGADTLLFLTLGYAPRDNINHIRRINV